MKKPAKYLRYAVVLAALVSACLPRGQPALLEIDQVATETAAAMITPSPLPSPSGTDEPLNSEKPFLAPTATSPAATFVEPTHTASATASPTRAIVTITTTGYVHVRSGPGTQYSSVQVLDPAVTVVAHGRNEDSSWLVLAAGRWISARVVVVTGDVSSLPVWEMPPTSTLQPLPTATRPAAPTRPPTPIPQPAVDCSRRTCGSFGSCAQVLSYLQSCPQWWSSLDRDRDGIPCESLCG